jgi:AcrR family transcriptional regulator
MTAATADPSRPGLRERKKQMTREAILGAAERLFAQNGYDGVTVAQIADAANVSVKTLFTYFDSKEDLVFGGEDDVRDALCAAVRDRPPGQSALEAMRGFLKALARMDGEDAGGIEGFHTAYGAVPQLHARLLLMFERFEAALARVLAEESGEEATAPAPRLAAAQLVSLLRLITSEEARERIVSRPARERMDALMEWIDASADLLAAGLGRYAVRPAENGTEHARP